MAILKTSLQRVLIVKWPTNNQPWWVNKFNRKDVEGFAFMDYFRPKYLQLSIFPYVYLLSDYGINAEGGWLVIAARFRQFPRRMR